MSDKSESNIFNLMFKHAEKVSLEEFDNDDLEKENIIVPEISPLQEEELMQQNIAEEGIITAIAGDVARDFTDTYKEIKGWFLGVESKRKYIDEQCLDTIEWLKEEDRDNKNLDLDMGKFKTWMKTSETFYWRYYFVLHDEIYNDIMKAIKKNEITEIEVMTDFNMKDRMKVTRMLDSAETIKDLIVVVEKYRARCNAIFKGLTNRKRTIQSFPFQIMLLGYADLNRTVKKIVNLAT